MIKTDLSGFVVTMHSGLCEQYVKSLGLTPSGFDFLFHTRPCDNKPLQGPVSLTVFPSQFKFDGNLVSLSPRLHYHDRYKILYMARQLCCRGMCKNLLRSDGQQRSYGKAKFPSYLNCGLKTVSETGPRTGLNPLSNHCYLIRRTY